MTSAYANFPVHETIDVTDFSDIRRAVDRMVENYARQGSQGNFSYRLLLPRGENFTAKARKMGLALQGEFILALKKKQLRPNVREVRYVHDDSHYGWVLASPEVYDRFEGKTS